MYLKGSNLYLRALEPEDLDVLYQAENDSSIWWLSGQSGPYSRFALREYIANSTNDIYTDKQLRLVIAQNQDDRVVGIIDLFDYSPRHERAELGALVFPEYRGKDYFAQALQLLHKFVRQHLGLHQIYAYVPVNNPASLHVLHQMGYVHSNVLKDWLKTSDGYLDADLLQILL